MPDTPALTVELRNEKPVELADFSRSFAALADEYDHFVASLDGSALSPDVKLYVQKVKGGSIVATLVALSPLALPFVENANTVIEFAKHVKTAFDAVLGRAKQPAKLPRRTYENLCTFVEPVAKDSASQINVNTTVKGDVNVHLHLNSLEANAAQNGFRREIAALNAQATGVHTGALMYLHQARNDPKSKAGDRGIIESISPNPVKVIFATEALKAAVLRGADNPFRCAFVVDVEVGTVNGRPMLYKVLNVHEMFDRDEPTEAA